MTEQSTLSANQKSRLRDNMARASLYIGIAIVIPNIIIWSFRKVEFENWDQLMTIIYTYGLIHTISLLAAPLGIILGYLGLKSNFAKSVIIGLLLNICVFILAIAMLLT